jgi:mono/diheme cytochrome c family protein
LLYYNTQEHLIKHTYRRIVMKRFFGIAAVALSVAFAGSAVAADGAAVYKTKCAACHGAEGQGTAMAPAVKGNEFIKTSSEADIAAVIKNGREGAAKKYKNFAIGMPKQTLGDEDVAAVIAHMKELAK